MFRSDRELENFLDNYYTWNILQNLPKINLTFFYVELNTGAAIVATQNLYCDYNGQAVCNVKYSIIIGENDSFPDSNKFKFYNPTGCDKKVIFEYFKFHTACEPVLDTQSDSFELSENNSQKYFDLTEKEEEIIHLMKDNNMNVRSVADKAHYSSNTIHYYLKKIREKTGFDPKTFSGLLCLITARKEK